MLPDGYHALARLQAQERPGSGKRRRPIWRRLTLWNPSRRASEAHRNPDGSMAPPLGISTSKPLSTRSRSAGRRRPGSSSREGAPGAFRDYWHSETCGSAAIFQRSSMPSAAGWPPSMTKPRRPSRPGRRKREPESSRDFRGRLRDLRLEQADVQERIRRSSPRLGSIESPTALDLRRLAPLSIPEPCSSLMPWESREASSSSSKRRELPARASPSIQLPVGSKDLEKGGRSLPQLVGTAGDPPLGVATARPASLRPFGPPSRAGARQS